MANEQPRVTPDGYTVGKDGWETRRTGEGENEVVYSRQRDAKGTVWYTETWTPRERHVRRVDPTGVTRIDTDFTTGREQTTHPNGIATSRNIFRQR